MKHHNHTSFSFVLLCFITLILAGCNQQASELKPIDDFISQQNIDKKKSDWKTNLPKPPQLVFKTESSYFWDLETNKGKVSIQLMPKIAPMHVSSTIYLTRLGFYDETIFHRVINGFMAQGGDPLGAGVGGPGYLYAGEFSPEAKHDKAGILSMANRGPNTDGSQFFITFKATPHLDGRHTVFGQVVEGMETLKVFESLGSYSGKTKEEIKIIKASIRIQSL
ncbi:peptidylprolyl isomerase [Aliikangiella sp. IMCC44359]|uniref:peptidylprolyl isomerase n=1 Tax=Aliikangiella sp. IMCC44359 TaxID=3459125 RepID=UPI00403B1834